MKSCRNQGQDLGEDKHNPAVFYPEGFTVNDTGEVVSGIGIETFCAEEISHHQKTGKEQMQDDRVSFTHDGIFK
jgi:hypothetical protein